MIGREQHPRLNRESCELKEVLAEERICSIAQSVPYSVYQNPRGKQEIQRIEPICKLKGTIMLSKLLITGLHQVVTLPQKDSAPNVYPSSMCVRPFLLGNLVCAKGMVACASSDTIPASTRNTLVGA